MNVEKSRMDFFDKRRNSKELIVMIDEVIWQEKYRPKKLDDVIGHEEIIRRLKVSVERKNIQHLLFSGPPGCGKTSCSLVIAKEIFGDEWRSNFKELNASVSKNTPILIKTDRNKIERVDFGYLDKYYGTNENINNVEVLTVDKNLRIKWSNISRLIKHKVNKILKVYYEGGSIELTGNHSVIVFDIEGNLISKAAGDLTEGDFLISFCTNIEDSKVIEETNTTLVNLNRDKSWLYGLYRSEGCLAANHIVFTLGSHEREYINRLRNVSENQFHVNTSETLVSSGFDRDRLSGNQVKLFSNNLVSFYRNMFYDKHCTEHTAHTKRVPFFMYGHSIENRMSYLKGEYEGDGSDLWERKNDDDTFRVTSVSKNSLVDIAWLGRTSNMHTSVYPENNVVNLLYNSYKSELLPAYVVINLLTKISNNNEINYNWRYDIRHVLYKRKDTKKGINTKITKKSLASIMDEIKPKNQGTLSNWFDVKPVKNKDIDKLETLLKGDIHVVYIKKIEIAEYDDYVYDVAVPENQMFFAGDIPVLLHNSDDRGIDIIRNQVKDFAMAQSLGTAGFKIILLDEADSLTKDAMNALRRIMERYSKVCRFILSCNYQSKIIVPIQSRCAIYKFSRVSNDSMKKRLLEICKLENVVINDEALEAICYVAEGDVRKAVNTLETAYLMGNNITLDSIYKSTGTVHPEVIIDFIKSCLMGERSAFDLLDIMMYEKGLAALDILKGMFKEVMSMNIKDKQIVDIIDTIGECDFRISEGANEAIQMKWLIARIMNIGH